MQTFIEKYHKIIVSIGVLLSVFLVVASLAKLKEMRFVGSGLSATNTITVSGTGKVERAPDTARVTFTVSEESKAVKSAQNTVSEKVAAISGALEDAGIESRYISTDSYNSYPQYSYPGSTCGPMGCNPGAPTIRGYQVSHTVTVAIKDLEKIETVLGILAENKVSDISGPNFGFEDDKAIAREARDMAIEDAREEAEKLAHSLGVKLVRIVSFNDNMGGGSPMPYARLESASDSMKAQSAPILPIGDEKVQTNVTVIYEIR